VLGTNLFGAMSTMRSNPENIAYSARAASAGLKTVNFYKPLLEDPVTFRASKTFFNVPRKFQAVNVRIQKRPKNADHFVLFGFRSWFASLPVTLAEGNPKAKICPWEKAEMFEN
jgi:hypothetical protein